METTTTPSSSGDAASATSVSEAQEPASVSASLAPPPSAALAAKHPGRARAFKARLDTAFHVNNHGRRKEWRDTYLCEMFQANPAIPHKEWIGERGSHWAHSAHNDEERGVYHDIHCDWATCGASVADMAEYCRHAAVHVDPKLQPSRAVRRSWPPGYPVDLLDGEMIWYPARILEERGERFLMRYDEPEWSRPDFDEWVWKDSPRIAPRGYYTQGRRILPRGTFLPAGREYPAWERQTPDGQQEHSTAGGSSEYSENKLG